MERAAVLEIAGAPAAAAKQTGRRYCFDETAQVEDEWVSAICRVEEACAEFCRQSEHSAYRDDFADHLTTVSMYTGELIRAALRLERISARLGEQYADL